MEAGRFSSLVRECREQLEPGEAERGAGEGRREGREAAEHSHSQTEEDRLHSQGVPAPAFQCQLSQDFLSGIKIFY